jgi:hypothetical protein
MKSSDDIKKGLAVCATLDVGCENCPYDDEKQLTCVDRSRRDALAYIIQLEDRNEKLENALRNLANSSSNARDAANKVIEHLKSRLAQVERERDALLEDMPRECHFCKYDHTNADEEPCVWCGFGNNWEWRGICSENAKEE